MNPLRRSTSAGLVLALLLAPTARSASSRAAVTVVLGAAVQVRPGPDALYSKPTAPQLENRGIWRAAPLLVSGASAYRSGEFLYQDYLFDETGSYPASRAYSSKNNADLVEVRLKPTASAIAMRLTLNSMQDPAQIGATIALGGTGVPYPAPHGAGTRMPGQVFITVHGTTGDIVDAATGQALPQHPRVSVDTRRRQVDVRIPYAAFDPRHASVRVAAAVGLWDPTTDAYRPGPSGSAFFNAAFRYTEAGLWANTAQTAALAAGDLTPFSATVDFAKLGAGTTDELADKTGGAPRSGWTSRIYASSFEPQQGRATPTDATSGNLATCVRPCALLPDFPGRLQPYSLYVPVGAPPAGGYPMVYFPHACGLSYRPLPAGERGDQLGDALHALVVLPEARGGCHWYWSLAATDVFEAVGDASRHYPVDHAKVYLTGGSMGGYGTYRLSAEWPDLFAAIAPVIGCTSADEKWPGPGTTPKSGHAATIQRLVPSWRNVPVHAAIGAVDDTCTASAARAVRDRLDELGYRYEWREYPGEHVSGGVEPSSFDDQQFSDFLSGKQVVTDPAHVSYVYNQKADERSLHLNADHAYWVSGLTTRDGSGAAPMGTIDVRSHGFGQADAVPAATQSTAGPGYTGQSRSWAPAASQARADVLDIVATNISRATIDVARARVSCHPQLHVTSDGPITLTLAGCSAAAVRSVPRIDATRTATRQLPATGGSTALGLLWLSLLTTAGALHRNRRGRRRHTRFSRVTGGALGC